MRKKTVDVRLKEKFSSSDGLYDAFYDIVFALIQRNMKNKRYGFGDPDKDWQIAFEIKADDSATQELFNRLKLDSENPLHWRAIVEAFSQAYFVPGGRPIEWTPEREIELGLDIYDITHPQTKKIRTIAAICKILREQEPFKKRYFKLKVARLRKVVAKLVGTSRPLGGKILSTLKGLYPDQFHEAFVRRGRDRKL